VHLDVAYVAIANRAIHKARMCRHTSKQILPANLSLNTSIVLNHSLPTQPSEHDPAILVDADACPVAIKEIVYRTAERRNTRCVVVANQPIAIPKSDWIRRITVSSGADQADHAIVEMVKPGDVVIADDIPLAARVIEKGGFVIGSRGDLFDDRNIHSRLAARDLMEQLRSAGMETEGPKPFKPKDAQSFANQLDRTLTKRIKAAERPDRS
jgi:uncharacterized protein YaiI (UPF0178 family)